MADEHVAVFIRSAADWVEKSAKALLEGHPDALGPVIDKLLDVLAAEPDGSGSALIRGNESPDWTMEAINSPTGDLAEAIWWMLKSRKLKLHAGLPSDIKHKMERMLALPGDLRRHALVIFCYYLTWFFAIDPKWTKDNLLVALDVNGQDDADALWAGFLWAGRRPSPELFDILKPHMIGLAKSGSLEKRGHAETLSAMLLSAWAFTDDRGGQRCLSDGELREILLASSDDLRSRMLWQVSRWSSEARESEDADGTGTGQEIDWPALLLALLRDVWPRQMAAKSPTISARMCDLVFDHEEAFEELAAVVIPLLTKVEGSQIFLPSLRRSKNNVVDKYPELVLSMLFAILPDDARRWPHGMDSTIDRIAEARPTLHIDERLIELRRRRDSR